MLETKLYINNRNDNDGFAEIVVKELNNELVLATKTDDKSFVCVLRGRTSDKFIFETKDGFTKTDLICQILSVRKYIPKEKKPPADKILKSTSW